MNNKEHQRLEKTENEEHRRQRALKMKMKMGPIQRELLRSQVLIKWEYEGLTPTCKS
jgi:hypothetical protein